MPVNFRNQAFKGTLLDLLQECMVWLPKREDLIFAQEMIELNSGKKTLRPILQYADYINRKGLIIPTRTENYIVVDDQITAGLWGMALEGQQFVLNLRELIEGKQISLSSHVDTLPKLNNEALKFREGVDKNFLYRHGIKLAPLFELTPKNIQVHTEADFHSLYLRTCSLLNRFPLPDNKFCEIKIRYTPNGFRGTKSNFFEHELIQKIIRSALVSHFGPEQQKYLLTESEFFKMHPVEIKNDWENIAKGFQIELNPRAQILEEVKQIPTTPIVNSISFKPNINNSEPKVEVNRASEKFVTEPMLIKFNLKDLIVYEQKKFYVDARTLELLKEYDRKTLNIRIKENSGDHPAGEYSIPNSVAVEFVQFVMGTSQWKKQNCFTSDVVPVALSKYFLVKDMQKAG